MAIENLRVRLLLKEGPSQETTKVSGRFLLTLVDFEI